MAFIKIDRRLTNWEWIGDPNMVSVWIYLLLSAQWEDTKYQGITIPRGSLLTGRKKISDKLGISEQVVRTCLNRLKSTNEITIQPTNRYSLITIVKWAEYQDYDDTINQQNNQQNTINQPTTNQQLTNNQPQYKKNKEELRRIKNRESIERFSPPSLEDIELYCRERQNNVDPERFLNFYSSKGWMVGKNKMKDWKACVRTWEQRDGKKYEEKEIYRSPLTDEGELPYL